MECTTVSEQTILATAQRWSTQLMPCDHGASQTAHLVTQAPGNGNRLFASPAIPHSLLRLTYLNITKGMATMSVGYKSW